MLLQGTTDFYKKLKVTRGLMDKDIKAWLCGSVLRVGKLARVTGHVLIVKMAVKPLPIKQSCSTVSEPMLSFRDFL